MGDVVEHDAHTTHRIPLRIHEFCDRAQIAITHQGRVTDRARHHPPWSNIMSTNPQDTNKPGPAAYTAIAAALAVVIAFAVGSARQGGLPGTGMVPIEMLMGTD
jgi:hypothetical protein